MYEKLPTSTININWLVFQHEVGEVARLTRLQHLVCGQDNLVLVFSAWYLEATTGPFNSVSKEYEKCYLFSNIIVVKTYSLTGLQLATCKLQLSWM